MMEENVKTLLLQTLHANESIRKNAEIQLKSLEKSPTVMLIIQNVLMNHPDQIVQQISSIFFANALKRNWKTPELKSFIETVESSILENLIIQNRYPKQAYDEIVQLIFENSELLSTEKIVKNSILYLNSNEPQRLMAALRLYDAVFKSEALRFNLDSVLSIIFNSFGTIFFSKFEDSLNSSDYKSSKMFMKIISRAYSHYSLPDYLLDLRVFKNCFTIAVQITKLQGSEEENFIKMKKWAISFLYKMSNKGLKKYFKNSEFVEFVKETTTLNALYEVFCSVIHQYSHGKKLHPRVTLLACEFFILICGNKHTKSFVKADYSFLLSNYILPILSYNDEIKEIFEMDEDNYLRNRYNYINDDLRSEASSLFTEIIQSDKEVQLNVLSTLKNALNNQSLPNYIPLKYGILGLLAENQRNMIKSFGQDQFDNFIVNYIIPNLDSECNFLVSQALYFMSLSEDNQLPAKIASPALDKVLQLLGSDLDSIPVEACLAMNFFMFNTNICDQMRSIVPGLLEKVVSFSKQYYLESLSSLMDTIIECYADDVAFYAPQFVDTLCSNILENIDSKEGDRVATVSGFITTIEKFIMVTDSKPDVVKKIYLSSSRVIYTIFSNNMEDYFQEAFDIMNSFLFTLKSVDKSMFEIFKVAISINKDELMLYPREVSDFIDNYLSFAKTTLIDHETLEKIYNSIDAFMPPVISDEEYDLYEEDYEAGCRIINSLMLNAGTAVDTINHNIIPCIVHKIISAYSHLDENSYMDMFGLEALMNCFIISPDSVLRSLASYAFDFFTEIYKKRNKFKRVYDKKIYILFIGVVFKLSIRSEINPEKINEALADMLESLPDAIKKRNKLKEDENKDYEENTDYDSGYESDFSAESLEEDIWFETDLDAFNPYEYVRNMLISIPSDSFGQVAISRMNSSQIQRIKNILEFNQEAEK